MDWFQQRRWHYLFLLGAGLVLFFLNLGGATLWDLDEGRNATAALEMLEAGNLVVPTFNGQLRVDKPALLYWGQMAAYRLFGINEFSARLPSALAGLLTLLVIYELGRRMFSPLGGLLAGLILSTTPMVCGAARFANPDALLNLFVALTLTLFWIGHHRPTNAWYALVGASAGFAVLAKGAVGFLLPGTIIFFYALWTGQMNLLWRRGILVGFWVFLLVASPWYVLVAVETKAEFLKGFILNHHVDRFLQPMESHRGWPGYYVLVLLIGTTPWSIFSGLVLWYAGWSSAPGSRRWPQRWEANADREASPRAYRFLIVWLASFLLFFSVSATKLPNYVLPACVPLALLTSRFLDRWCRGRIQPAGWLVHLGLGSLALIGLATGVGLYVVGQDYAFLRQRQFPELARLAPLGILPILGALLGWWYWRKGRVPALIGVLYLMTLLYVGPLAGFAGAALNHHKGTRDLIEQAGACLPHEDIRVACFRLDYLPSLNFYCRRDLVHLRGEEELDPFLKLPLPVFLIIPLDAWNQMEPKLTPGYQIVARGRELYRNQELVVVANR